MKDIVRSQVWVHASVRQTDLTARFSEVCFIEAPCTFLGFPGGASGKEPACNAGDLREAEDIKKRRQEYTEELCKKDFNDPDNHNAMV